jgi:hypothetical protein
MGYGGLAQQPQYESLTDHEIMVREIYSKRFPIKAVPITPWYITYPIPFSICPDFSLDPTPVPNEFPCIPETKTFCALTSTRKPSVLFVHLKLKGLATCKMF